jgi:endosialidase-like protein
MNFHPRFSVMMTTALIGAAAPFAHATEIQLFPPVVEGTVDTTCPATGVRTPLTWDGQSNVACAQGVTIAGGRVGIGTAAPENFLDINGAASIGYNVAAPSDGLIVSGSVGIGTPTPAYPLDIDVTSASVNATAARIFGNTQKGGVGLVLQNNIAGGDVWGLVSEGGSSAPVGSFGIYDNGLPGERLVILSTNGYVGIGTPTPQAKLDVVGGISAKGPVVTSSVATPENLPDYSPYTPLSYFDEVYPGVARIASAGVNSSTRGSFIYYSSSSDNSLVTVPFMVIPNGSQDYTGINLPIGDGPSYPLHVNGTVYATGGAGALSDRRHKTDIEPLAVDALDMVAKLKPVTFLWKTPRMTA